MSEWRGLAASSAMNTGADSVQGLDSAVGADSVQGLDTAAERGHRIVSAGPESVVTDPLVFAFPLKGLFPFKGKGRAMLPPRLIRSLIDSTDQQVEGLWEAMRLLSHRSRVVPGLTLQATRHGRAWTTGARISVRWRRTRDRVWTTLADGLADLYRDDRALPDVALDALRAADAEADLLNASADMFRNQRRALVCLAAKRAQTTRGVER